MHCIGRTKMLHRPNAEGVFTAPRALITDADEKRSIGKIIQHPCCLVTI